MIDSAKEFSTESLEIIYAKESLIPSFYKVLSEVAKEKIYLEMIEAPEFLKVENFQKDFIINNQPSYYAVVNNDVIGWIDISIGKNPRTSHRGFLGMGVLKKFRGRGVGSKLIQKALEHAKMIDLEKVELSVYTSNKYAIKLYKKYGFTEIGVIKNYRKLEGQYFDILMMEKFL